MKTCCAKIWVVAARWREVTDLSGGVSFQAINLLKQFQFWRNYIQKLWEHVRYSDFKIRVLFMYRNFSGLVATWLYNFLLYTTRCITSLFHGGRKCISVWEVCHPVLGWIWVPIDLNNIKSRNPAKLKNVMSRNRHFFDCSHVFWYVNVISFWRSEDRGVRNYNYLWEFTFWQQRFCSLLRTSMFSSPKIFFLPEGISL